MRIENVTTVNSYQNSIYYIDSKGNFYESGNDTSSMIKTEDYASIYFNGTMIYIVSSCNGKLIATYPISNSTFDFSISKIENGLVYFRNGGLFDSEYGVAKVEGGNFNILVPLGDLNVILLYKDLVIGYLHNRIVCKDFGKDRVLWEIEQSDFGFDPRDNSKYDGIKEVLGVIDNNLWIYTNAGRLHCFDIQNGLIKKRISGNPLDLDTEYCKTDGLGRCYIDEKSSRIISISSLSFKIINGENGNVETHCIYGEVDKEGIGKYARVYAPLHQGDYFTFIAEKDADYGGSRYIGVFDYAKRKLVWEYEVFTQEEINTTRNKLVPPQQLKITEDGKRMYIKDFHNTLHIFEKE